MSTEQARHPVSRPIVGTAETVGNVLRTAQRQGRLVSYSRPRPLTGGRIIVDAIVLDVSAETPVRRRFRPRLTRKAYARIAVVLVALSALTGVIVAAVAALRWIVGHAPIIAGAVVVIVLCLATLRRRTGVCLSIHQPGCGHR